MKKSTHNLLWEVIQELDKTITIDFVDTNDDLHTVYTCNTLWLTVSEKEIIIDGNTYKVRNVSPFATNNGLTKPYVVFQGDEPIEVTEFDIPLPAFYHGTILRVNNELQQVPNAWDKLPFIYLRGEIEERFIEDGTSGDAIYLESPCRIYMMAEVDIEDWTGSQHETLACTPMRNLANGLLETFRKSSAVGKFEDFRLTNKVKWGQYEDAKGNVDQIFKDFLSGCELEITIPFTRTAECCTN